MKLLLDENLSYRMLADLEMAFPESNHVVRLGLETADDRSLWNYARAHDFVLVTQDVDFHELATLYGSPPKIIWLKCGNRPRPYITSLLLGYQEAILTFGEDPDSDTLELT